MRVLRETLIEKHIIIKEIIDIYNFNASSKCLIDIFNNFSITSSFNRKLRQDNRLFYFFMILQKTIDELNYN